MVDDARALDREGPSLTQPRFSQNLPHAEAISRLNAVLDVLAEKRAMMRNRGDSDYEAGMLDVMADVAKAATGQ